MTGELWAGDVGQSKYEEVDRIVLGGNYGWNTREGKHCFGDPACPTDGLIDPVVEYDRSEGVSITGGYVYRGTKIPALFGKYIYGDFGTGRIWAVETERSRWLVRAAAPRRDAASRSRRSAQDADGELFVADYGTGTLQQLVAPPRRRSRRAGPGVSLAETGCLDPEGCDEAAARSPRLHRQQPALVRRRHEGSLALRPRGREDRRARRTATSTSRPGASP